MPIPSKSFSALLSAVTFSLILAGCSGGGDGDDQKPAVPAQPSTPAAESTGFLIKSVSSNPQISSQCGTAGGVAIYQGQDKNNNRVLDANEYFDSTAANPNPQIICHGLRGETGRDGTDGHTPQITTQTLAKNSQQCPAGGYLLVIDDQQHPLCNPLGQEGEQPIITDPQASTATLSGTVPAGAQAQTTYSPNSLYTARKVTSRTGSLWLTPDAIAAAIQQDIEQKQNAAQAALTQAIEVPVEADGSYEIKDLPAGTGYSLVYIDDNGQGKKIEDINLAPGETKNQNIQQIDLKPTGSATLKLQSLRAGTPIHQASARLHQLNEDFETDENGILKIEGLPEGTYSISIQAQGYVSRYVSFTIQSAQTTDLETIELNDQQGSLAGSLTLNGVSDYSNVIVYARAIDNSVYTTLTNASGNYRFPALPVGEGYSLIATINGYQSAKLDGINIQTQRTTTANSLNLSQIVRQVGRLEGYARFAGRTDMQHAGIIVSIEGTDYEAITARDGSYIINNLEPGTYTVNFTDSNHETQTQQVTVVATAATRPQPIELIGRTGNITGIIHNEQGQAVVNATVTIQTPAQTHSTVTNDQGQYQIQGVLAGQHTLSVTRIGFGSAQQTISITQNQQTDLTSSPVAIARKILTGKINLVGEDNNSGVSITLLGGDSAPAISDAQGQFTLYGVNAGSYQLQVSLAGYISQTLPISFTGSEGYEIPYTIDLVRSLGVMKGQASLANRVDHSGIKVELVGTDSYTYTDALGNWVMQVSTGAYSSGVRYSTTHFAPQTQLESFTISQFGETSRAPVRLLQTSAEVQLQLSAVGACRENDLKLVVRDKSNQQFTFHPDAQGTVNLTSLPLGSYTAELSCVLPGWETRVLTLDLTNDAQQIILDPVQLRQSFATINQGAEFTNSRNVNLAIGNTDATKMKIIEGAKETDFIDFVSSYALELTEDDGLKTVRIDFLDANNQPLSSVSDQITLDTTIQVASASFSGAATKGDTLKLQIDLGETQAKVTADIPGLAQGVVLLDRGILGDAVANDGIYTRELVVLSAQEVNGPITFNIIDRAGNQLAYTTQESLVINTPPSFVSFNTSSNIAKGEMQFNFAVDEPVTAWIEYGATEGQLLNTQIINATLATNHQTKLTGLAPNSMTYYRVKIQDAVGNITERQGRGKLAPAPLTGLQAFEGHQEVGLTWPKSTGQNIIGYNLYRSEDGQVFTKLNGQNPIDTNLYVDNFVANEVTYHYRVTAIDRDLNESLTEQTVTATPKASHAGPTEVAGGIIKENLVWLASKSPYRLTDNMRIDPGAELLVMPGAQIEFVQGDTTHTERFIRIDGALRVQGTETNRVILTADQIKAAIRVNSATASISYADMTDVSIIDLRDSDYRETSMSVSLKSVNLNIDYNACNDYSPHLVQAGQAEFVNVKVKNVSTVKGRSCFRPSLNFSEVTNSYFTIEATDITLQTLESLSVIDSDLPVFFNLNLNSGNIVNSTIEYGYVSSASLDKVTVKHATLHYTSIVDSIIQKSQLSGPRLVTRNVLDDVYVSVVYEGDSLYLYANYWGTTDINEIADRSGFRGIGRLYPIISGPDIRTADFDGDGIPDFIDNDTDGDGISNLQEERLSEFAPEFGERVIYNPLDKTSYPRNVRPDNDMDGIPDDEDNDWDGDGLTNEEEMQRGTNPWIADTDGDGVDDGTEVKYGYDPLDPNSKPLIGYVNGGVINMASHGNTLGKVVIMPGVNLANLTVEAGTHLYITRGAAPSFTHVHFAGELGQPVVFEFEGRNPNEATPSVQFVSSTLEFVDLSNMNGYILNASNSIITNNNIGNVSDPQLTLSEISNSFITLSDAIILNSTKFVHNYLNGRLHFDSTSQVRDSFINGNLDISQGQKLMTSVVSGTVYMNGGSLENSIVNYVVSGGHYQLKNVDTNYISYTSQSNDDRKIIPAFLDGVYINGRVYGLGSPVDTKGDGSYDTKIDFGFTGADAGEVYVDGIVNPRSSPNFPNGVSDLWSMNNVGVGAYQPGLASNLAGKTLYYQAPAETGNQLNLSQLQFNRDGTVAFEMAQASPNATTWSDATTQLSGYWSVAGNRVSFVWDDASLAPYQSLDLVVYEDGSIGTSGNMALALLTEKPAPMTEAELFKLDLNFYILRGQIQEYDYFKTPIKTERNYIVRGAYQDYTNNKFFNFDIPVTETGAFELGVWTQNGLFRADMQTGIRIFEDVDQNGVIDSFDIERVRDIYITGRTFGTASAPLPVVHYGYADFDAYELLQHETIYHYYADGSMANDEIGLKEITLIQNGTARFKYYQAKFGENNWTYQGACEGLGCIPAKEDEVGSWEVSNQASAGFSISEVYSTQTIVNRLNLFDSNQSNFYLWDIQPTGSYQAIALDDRSVVIFNTLPAVPSNPLLNTIGFETLNTYFYENGSYVSGNYWYQLETFVGKTGIKAILNTNSGFAFYGHVSNPATEEFGGAYIGGRLNLRNFSTPNSFSFVRTDLNSLARLNDSGEIIFVVNCVEGCLGDVKIVQQPSSWPEFVVNSWDWERKRPSSTKLAVSQLLNVASTKTFSYYLGGDEFVDLTFDNTGAMSTQRYRYDQQTHQFIDGDYATGTWTDNGDNSFSFDYLGQAINVNLYVAGTQAYGLWDNTNNIPMVWLTSRPSVLVANSPK